MASTLPLSPLSPSWPLLGCRAAGGRQCFAGEPLAPTRFRAGLPSHRPPTTAQPALLLSRCYLVLSGAVQVRLQRFHLRSTLLYSAQRFDAPRADSPRSPSRARVFSRRGRSLRRKCSSLTRTLAIRHTTPTGLSRFGVGAPSRTLLIKPCRPCAPCPSPLPEALI